MRVAIEKKTQKKAEKKNGEKNNGKQNGGIAPAEGKLGVLLVGLGAVSTTFIAGVEAIKRGLAEPVGSVTQMGTVR
jgi:myo-inositol-1-phosphate synthase